MAVVKVIKGFKLLIKSTNGLVINNNNDKSNTKMKNKNKDDKESKRKKTYDFGVLNSMTPYWLFDYLFKVPYLQIHCLLDLIIIHNSLSPFLLLSNDFIDGSS